MSNTKSAAEIVENLEKIKPDGVLKVSDLVEQIGNKGSSLLILIIGLFSLGPAGAIPGVDMAAGGLLVLAAVQIFLGGGKPYIPNFVGKREIQQETFEKMLKWARKPAKILDRFIGKRLNFIFDHSPRFLFPLVILMLGLFMMPLALVPFAVAIPAFITVLVSLAYILKDGFILLTGYTLAFLLPIVAAFIFL